MKDFRSQFLWLAALFTIVSCAGIVAVSGQTSQGNQLRAPTYYLAPRARGCNSDEELSFDGASNLPAGALIGVKVRDFNGGAWKDYTDEMFFPLDDKGFFKGVIRARKGMIFHANLLLDVEFTTFRPKQPPSVVKIVGRNGVNLGGIENPQLFQVSGPYYLLEAIARVMGCNPAPEK